MAANFSLLYPKVPGESSNQQNMFLEANPDAAHDWDSTKLLLPLLPLVNIKGKSNHFFIDCLVTRM